MSVTLEKIKELIAGGEFRISEHGYDELADDKIFVRDAIKGVASGICVEDYPNFAKGACVLILEHDAQGIPFHAVWGIPKGCESPAVLITAYRPDPKQWSKNFMKRLEHEQ